MTEGLNIGVARPPNELYADFDRGEIELLLQPRLGKNYKLEKSDIVAIYRVGSRTYGGKPRADSDIDYLVIRDSNKHLWASNTSFRISSLNNPNAVYIERIEFSRKDLEEPEKMEGLVQKLLFLHGIHKGRELVWGEDVLPKWLSPSIMALFQKHKINDETVGRVNAWAKGKKLETLSIDAPPQNKPLRREKNH